VPTAPAAAALPVCRRRRCRWPRLRPGRGGRFTVNHSSAGGLPPPTSSVVGSRRRGHGHHNIVGCRPPTAHRDGVRVVFEKPARYVPLFEAESRPRRASPPGARRREGRPDRGARGIGRQVEERVALTGVGQSAWAGSSCDPVRLTWTPAWRGRRRRLTSTTSTGCPPTQPDGRRASPRRDRPLTEALQLRPTWINGPATRPGKACHRRRHARGPRPGVPPRAVLRTLWESSYAPWSASAVGQPAARATGMTEYLAPFARVGRDWIAVQASRYFHRYAATRSTLGWVAVSSAPTPPATRSGLPRSVHHRRLLRGPPGDHAVRTVRLRRAGGRRVAVVVSA